MALRMHVYVSLLLQICSGKTSSPRKASSRLFCRIVLYNGAKAWSAADDLADLLRQRT